jgi:hypothetical protein
MHLAKTVTQNFFFRMSIFFLKSFTNKSIHSIFSLFLKNNDFIFKIMIELI